MSTFESVNSTHCCASGTACTSCAPDTKEHSGAGRAPPDKALLEQEGFGCGGNERPQPALVPSLDSVWLQSELFTVQHCGHISCWPCMEVTDAHECTQDLVCQQSSSRGKESVEGMGKVAACRLPDGEGRGRRMDQMTLARLPSSNSKQVTSLNGLLSRASPSALSWRNEEKQKTAPAFKVPI